MIYSEGDAVRIVSGCSCGCAYLDHLLGEEGVVTKIELYTDGELMRIEVEIPGVYPLEVLDYSSLELVGVKGAKPEDCF